MADINRSILDELMGRDRNLSANDKKKKMERYSDDNVNEIYKKIRIK